MAMNMDAMLKIRASVEGQNQIVALNRGLQSVGATAAGVTGAMRGLTGAAGGLSGALGTLAPLLSAAGLVGMVKNTIEAGDKMHDLAQSTGVSVEALARFKKAAAVSGTSLEGVSKGLVMLSKTMLDAATGGKASVATFQALGISVKSADGSLKSADQVMLEVADRFKAMPDGAAKTALALRLFGKSGAELVPMLNMGGAAIDNLKVKMTAAFAKRADAYSDKLAALSGKVGALGADLTIALLPALEQITNALTTAVTAFNDLPAPIKSVAVGAATLAVVWGPLSGALGGATKLLAGVANGLEFMRYQAALAGGVMPLLTGGIEGMSAAILAIPGWGWALAGVTALGLLGKALYDNNSAFKTWVDNVAAIVASDFQNAMKNMAQLGSAAARGVGQAWDWLVNATSKAANAIGQAFGAPFGFISNAAQQVFGMVAGAIGRMWNAIPAPVRKVLGDGALNALGPTGYAIGVGIRAFQMPPQQGASPDAKVGAAPGVRPGFSLDLNALETGGSGGGTTNTKKESDNSDRIRQQISDAENAAFKSRAELAILRELNPVKKIQLEYDEKRRQLIEDSANAFQKALSLEEEGSIQARQITDLKRLDIEETNALNDKYKELGEAAHDAALSTQEWTFAAEAAGGAMAGMRDGIASYLESIGSLSDNFSDLTQNGLKGLEDAIVSLTTTGTGNFRQFALSMIEETSRMVTRLLILAPILQFIQSLMPGAGPLSGTNALSTTKLTPGGVFADGGVFSNGIVTSPTLFKFANGGAMNTGLMGEAGPEAILPLKRGRDGKLGVAAGSGGGTNITVNVDASGNSQVAGDSGQAAALGRAISQAVQNELLRQKRPGGLLAA